MNKLGAILTLAIIGVVFISTPTHALASGHGNQLNIVINPQYPTPYKRFSLSTKSSSLNILDSSFSVYVNGIYKTQGSGSNAVTLVATGPGTTMNTVVVTTIRGVKYSKSIRIRPAGVALVIEPLSTSPVLYKGKPTIPSAGNIRIVAIPNFRTSNGIQISSNKLSYIWKIGNQTLGTSSGIGKSVVIIPAPLPYRNEKLSVTIQTQDSTRAASAKVEIAPQTPTVRIYKNDPLLGVVYNHSLSGAQTIENTEASFTVEPFGFSISNGLPSLNWYLNGIEAQTGSTITLRPQGVGVGSSSLSVTAIKKITYENASQNVSLKFGTSVYKELGIFGL